MPLILRSAVDELVRFHEFYVREVILLVGA